MPGAAAARRSGPLARLGVTAGLALLLVCPAGGKPDSPEAFLHDEAGFTDEDLARVRRGGAVARALDTAEADEVAVCAAVRIAISKEAFAERFRDIERFKHGGPVRAVGRVGSPPRPEDFAGLELPPRDVDALGECVPGDCHFALQADDIARVRRELGRAPSAGAATAWARGRLVAYVDAYLRLGNAALPVYASRTPPVDVAEHFAGIVRRSPYIAAQMPGLRRYLLEFPRVDLAGLESFVYWSLEEVASRAVVSVTHVAIHRDPDRRDRVVIASKQVYASHFFEASLGLTIAQDDLETTAAAPGLYLIYLNRTRSDALTGVLGPIRRAVVRSRSRSGAEALMRETKGRLERGAPDR